jgi:hypothetical protein
MKRHIQLRTPRQRPKPLQPSPRAMHPAHPPGATSRVSQITNHASQLPRCNPPSSHNYAHQIPTFLINGAPIRNVRNSQKTNNGARF